LPGAVPQGKAAGQQENGRSHGAGPCSG